MFRVFIYLHDNVKRECQAGATIRTELNDTLDSASIVLKGIASTLDIQPMDKVYLTIENENGTELLRRRFLINSFQESITRKADATIYNYSITLISETKELEGIPLPNLVITNDNELSVLDYIKRYNNLYGHYTINDTDFSGFNTICPNLQWNAPTLREVLNDLCLIKDSLISLENGVLKPKNISNTLGEFNGINVPYINRSQSLDDYSSELHSELGNAIDIDTTKIINDSGYRNDDVAYFTTTANGVVVKTDRPIYNLISFKIYVKIGNRHSVIDMTEYVKEVGVYNNLLQGYSSSYLSPNYKCNCVYYSRGTNDIQGFTLETRQNIKKVPVSVIENWKAIILSKIADENYDEPITANDIEDLQYWKFKIEYVSIGSQTYRLSRGTNYHRIRNYRVTIDNQDNSSIDVKKFVDFEKLKLNRISNDIMLLRQAQCDNISNIANLGQTFNTDYIIFSKNLVVNRRTIEAEYYASKKYVLANYFTNIRSQKRNYEWVNTANSVQRQEYRKIYYELSFTNPNDVINLSYIKHSSADLGLDIFNGADNDKILKTYALSPFFDKDTLINFYKDDARNIKIETGTNNLFYYGDMLNIGGNMQCVRNIVNYNFQLDDNVFAGYKVKWETYQILSASQTAFYNYGVNYNENTEKNTFDQLLVKLGGHTKLDEADIMNSNNIQLYANLMPIAGSTRSDYQNYEGMCQTFAFDMYKDNAEKLGLSFNFEWVSDNNDIEILKPAEVSLYKLNVNNKAYYVNDHITYYDSESALQTPVQLYPENIPTSLKVKYNNNIVFYGLYFDGNDYYLDSGLQVRVSTINLTNASSQNMVHNGYYLVYDTRNNKVYLKRLNSKASQTEGFWLEAVESVEYTSATKVYTHDLQAVISITDINNLALSNENLTISNTYPIANIVGGSGTVNLTNGYLEITPTSNEITINNAIAIHNANSHVSSGKIKIYLKIKDTYL